MKKKRFNIPFILALLLALMLSGCLQPEDARTSEQSAKTYAGVIVAMGDSLTAGYGVEPENSYPAQLQGLLEAKGLHWKVINSGVSGETSSGALSRLNWVLSLKPDIVILETGANDGLRGVDPNLTKKNILKIIHELQKKKIVTILAGMRMVSNLGTIYTHSFHQIYLEAAKETGVIFIPFFLKDVATIPSLNISDGIHPNKHGYQILVKNLFPYVLQAIKIYEYR